MLIQLRIKNLVLVDFEEINFHEGYNVISGETGSGKSAILQALRLISGTKFDSELLRHGENYGWVEAIFSMDEEMRSLLLEAGIEGDDCIVRRELRLEKGERKISRGYVNSRLVSADFLKTLLSASFEVLSQKAPFLLQDPLYQQRLFDEYGEIDLTPFQSAFSEVNALRDKMSQKENALLRLSRERDFILYEIEEIASHIFQEGEDKTLFEEYSHLITLGEQETLLSDLQANLNLNALHQCRRDFQALVKLSQLLSPLFDQFVEDLSSLREIERELQKYGEKLSVDPSRLAHVSTKLEKIEKLKKKHGQTFTSIQEAKERLKKRLFAIDEEVASFDLLEEALEKASSIANAKAAKISRLRASISVELKSRIETTLRELNMVHAEFEARLIPSERSTFGDERVELYVRTNRHDKWLSIRESGSGGELARLLLAFRLALASKKGTSTLLFDEIDAHIGGETAQLVGKKLVDLASFYQVIVVTHFPQVAKHAHHHILVEKVEAEKGTFTKITSLHPSSRQAELDRMAGTSSH